MGLLLFLLFNILDFVHLAAIFTGFAGIGRPLSSGAGNPCSFCNQAPARMQPAPSPAVALNHGSPALPGSSVVPVCFRIVLFWGFPFKVASGSAVDFIAGLQHETDSPFTCNQCTSAYS